ncbi:hypothetical protein [Pantoea ananatis]|uniref:hypothetical protein n=1 Tax=Pantoea ananas TaxID=553 RepID=UPI001B3131E8|nr:hypothetical protein [Pantoea ananatis]
MYEQEIADLVKNIRDHRSVLDATAQLFRTQEKKDNFNPKIAEDWCNSVFGDSLVKLRLFTENNFNYIESLSLISVTRYIFEMSVWLKLLTKDSRYGIVYYSQLLKGQREYWTRFQEQMNREVVFLEKMYKEERDLTNKRLGEVKIMGDTEEATHAAEKIFEYVKKIIDEKADRSFSIFSEEAKFNGYGFQSVLVKKNQLEKTENALIEIANEKEKFEENLPEDVKKMVSNNIHWKWDQKAKEAQLEDEYNFIYTFTSKLLHAVPTSITTDHKNLEYQEMVFLLRYINVKIKDIIELSRAYINKRG